MSEPSWAVRVESARKEFARERDPKSVFRALRAGLGFGHVESVVALQEVTFELPRGGKMAVIGDNGSGKTTLLKLLVGLYPPTAGTVEVEGDVSLVAGLGIGMVDELSVEENLILHGAIYGMERERLRSSLIAEILEWADLGAVREARLKTLSNGMRSRLAFSAMRHVEASVYLMDEVLSAGDRHFKEKCEAVFEEYRRSPATLVVATHVLAFVREFSDLALWLHRGTQLAFGQSEDVVARYLAHRGG